MLALAGSAGSILILRLRRGHGCKSVGHKSLEFDGIGPGLGGMIDERHCSVKRTIMVHTGFSNDEYTLSHSISLEREKLLAQQILRIANFRPTATTRATAWPSP